MKKHILLINLLFLGACTSSPNLPSANYDRSHEEFNLNANNSGFSITNYASILAAAEQGNPQAQFYLGMMLDTGRGIQQDTT
ncbi:hypothetical protein ACR30L_00355 [Psychromonas sp. PT13]|uniref:hypothetical protein n=1 Tax=Psychromonas sp. PT13 TaxID=3439547 RepID=UPI003EBE835A